MLLLLLDSYGTMGCGGRIVSSTVIVPVRLTAAVTIAR